MPKKLSIEERLAKLESSPKSKPPSELSLSEVLFPQQLAAAEDPSPFKLWLCSRRSGKSTAIAYRLIKVAREVEYCTALYVTGARTNAKTIVWAEIKRINQEKGYGGVPNESELTLTFPHSRSVVRLMGAKDLQSIEKIRGQLPPVQEAYIDEAQAIRDHILTVLIDDVLEPALLDCEGSMILAGTPPPIPIGYFVDQLKNPAWKVFRWTFFDNPYILKRGRGTHQQRLDRVLKRRGLTVESPAIRREYFGELALDPDSLVYCYNASKNDYMALPQQKYTYVLGIDVGYEDADALAVIGWSDTDKITYLVEEVVTKKQGLTELVDQVEALRKKYDISKIVMDMGGLGKKLAEEMIRRYKIPVEAAEKVRKNEYIELFNDALRTGAFKAKSGSHFANDSMRMEWDLNKSTPERKVVSDRYHSDICDAVLYAWRYSYSFTYTKPVDAPKYGTKEYWDAERDRMEEQAEEYFKRLEDLKTDPYDPNNF